MKWNNKQKKAFIEIQNRIYNKMGLTNKEVAEMHTLTIESHVFSIFQFMTSKWIGEFAERERLHKKANKQFGKLLEKSKELGFH